MLTTVEWEGEGEEGERNLTYPALLTWMAAAIAVAAALAVWVWADAVEGQAMVRVPHQLLLLPHFLPTSLGTPLSCTSHGKGNFIPPFTPRYITG